MPPINYEILYRKLDKKYHHIVEELVQFPKVENLGLLPKIKRVVYSSPLISFKRENLKKEYFVAVVLTLYDPDHLKGYKKIRSGLRVEISKQLGCSPTLISHISTNLKTRLKSNKNDKIIVDKLSDMVCLRLQVL